MLVILYDRVFVNNTATGAGGDSGGSYINVGVTLTLKLVNLWALIESDTGYLVWATKTKKGTTTTTTEEEESKKKIIKSGKKLKKFTHQNRNLTPTTKYRKNTSIEKMSDTPVVQSNARSEKIKSSDPNAANNDNNNHQQQQQQQCIAPHNSANKAVIY